MTTEKKVARRKLSLLELAQELGNVSKACTARAEDRSIRTSAQDARGSQQHHHKCHTMPSGHRNLLGEFMLPSQWKVDTPG